LTNDTIWMFWQDGIQDMLINFLSKSPKLKSNNRSINDLINTGTYSYVQLLLMCKQIQENWMLNVFIFGSIKQAGSKNTSQCTINDSTRKKIIKSFEIENRKRRNHLPFIVHLKIAVRNFLLYHKCKWGISWDSGVHFWLSEQQVFLYDKML